MILPKLNNFVFFGTDEFAVIVLENLLEKGLPPNLIITTPDAPRGRGRILTPPRVKLWAIKNGVEYEQPEKLLESYNLKAKSHSLFLVASYGKIIPPEILALPTHGVLNIHPSLLPKYRGPTPIQSAILAGEEETGVTIMLMDEQIDHGPLLKASNCPLLGFSFWEIRERLAKLGVELFVKILPDYLTGKIKPEAQDHTQATLTKKIKKEDGLINLTDDPALNYRKFLALTPSPGIYFFTDRRGQKIRVLITVAHLDANQKFVINKVKPEGRKEMSWQDFERGQRN